MKKRLKEIFTDQRIALLIRWWAVGAVYFFIGWGTPLGQSSLIDFVFFLGLTIGVFNMFVVNPLIRNMFNVEGKPYIKGQVKKNVLLRLSEIIKSMVIVFIMVYIYNIINMIIIALTGLSKEQVPFAGEPISFGIIYILIWALIDSFIRNIKKRIHDKENMVKTI